MRILCIGDIHGRSIWKLIEQREEKDYDKIVFIGDYWDSFNIPFKEQCNNFLDICQFKQDNPDKVILLFGNHDYHYLPCATASGEVYSGFQDKYAFLIQKEIEQALSLDLLQMCHVHGEFCFTHAGITNTWLKNNEYDKSDVEWWVNGLFKNHPNSFRFVGRDCYGNSKESSPIWVRPESLVVDVLYPYIHVVGHTRVRNIKPSEGMVSRAIFIDTLDNKNEEYLMIDTDKQGEERFEVKKL